MFRSSASIEFLRRRAELLREARCFFDSLGFIEVQTPVLSRDTVIDRHLEPWSVRNEDLKTWGFGDGRAFLQTSPEFAMKRLLVSGLEAIYQIGPVFRGGERGRLHNPEFTMLEWYRVGDGLEQGIGLLSSLVKTVLSVGEATRLKYADAFKLYTGINVRDATKLQLTQKACELKLVDSESWSDDWDDWCNLLFSEVVQPQLGWESPVVVSHFPASQSALAKLAKDDPREAERFELFYRGVELANGYHELLDPQELRARNRQVNHQRAQDGKECLPEESRLLEAMEVGMPSSAGCALGWDRLVMLARNSKSIDEVMAFPIERA